MGDWIKKYWTQILFIGGGLVTGITYFVMLEPRIPNSVEEMVEIREATEQIPVLLKTIEFDSLETEHGKAMRQVRFEKQEIRDSIKDAEKRRHDSLTIDAFKRFTVQIEQMSEKIDNIHN